MFNLQEHIDEEDSRQYQDMCLDIESIDTLTTIYFGNPKVNNKASYINRTLKQVKKEDPK